MALASQDRPPAPGRWSRPPLKVDRERPQKVVFLSCMALMPVCLLAHRTDLLFSLPFVAFAALMVLSSHRGNDRVPTTADLYLLENPDDSEVCLVEVTLRYDGLSSAWDRGVAWFEDGRLLFVGHRTSFALGGQDVVPTRDWPEFTSERNHGLLQFNAVPLRIPNSHHSVAFIPLERKGTIGEMQRACFEHRLAHFRKDPRPSSGPRQWPPFAP